MALIFKKRNKINDKIQIIVTQEKLNENIALYFIEQISK